MVLLPNTLELQKMNLKDFKDTKNLKLINTGI